MDNCGVRYNSQPTPHGAEWRIGDAVMSELPPLYDGLAAPRARNARRPFPPRHPGNHLLRDALRRPDLRRQGSFRIFQTGTTAIAPARRTAVQYHRREIVNVILRMRSAGAARRMLPAPRLPALSLSATSFTATAAGARRAFGNRSTPPCASRGDKAVVAIQNPAPLLLTADQSVKATEIECRAVTMPVKK